MKASLRTGWLFLAAGALGFGLHAAHLPAAWLFGPLLASAFFAVRGWESFQLPKPVYLGAQAVIGTALGAGFSPSNLLILPRHPWIFVFAVGIILVLSLFNGWLLTRHTRLDVATAFLGTMPGGAGEMAAMSDSLGADTRLVVVMQYLRLLLILASLALVVPFLGHGTAGAAAHAAVILPAPASAAGWQIGILALVSAAGWCAGMFTRIPAGTFLVPTLLYFGLDFLGVQPGRWPVSVFLIAYVVLGLQIGGRFRRSTLEEVRDILLPVIGTTLLLLGGSVALAALLSRQLGLDAVSAYLAATPGGLDSVAAIANEVQGNMAIILTIHFVRLMAVLLAGPWLVRGSAQVFDDDEAPQTAEAAALEDAEDEENAEEAA